MPGVIRLDEQFTRQTMIDGLQEGYPVVHIASHFRFSPERLETSYLLLGDGSDLTLDELQNLPGIFEKVELLTLSACDTATVGANGKEMEGLAFVAQNLGAKTVLASLWPVADEGTEVLMREFYRLKEANPQWSKAEALRQAQIALLKRQGYWQQASIRGEARPWCGSHGSRKRNEGLHPRRKGAVWSPALLGTVHIDWKLEMMNSDTKSGQEQPLTSQVVDLNGRRVGI